MRESADDAWKGRLQGSFSSTPDIELPVAADREHPFLAGAKNSFRLAVASCIEREGELVIACTDDVLMYVEADLGLRVRLQLSDVAAAVPPDFSGDLCIVFGP